MTSLCALGAEPAAIRIRVKNPGALAAKQGGTAGAVASVLLPATVSDKVLTTIASELKKGLQQQGVDAEVAVVSDVGAKPISGQRDFITGAAVGAGVTGVGLLLWRLIKNRLL